MTSHSNLPEQAPSPSKVEMSAFALFQEEFEKEKDAEKKLRMAIDFMRNALSQLNTPRFKDFWEVKRLCLALFKENLSAKSRATLWEEYTELSNEARRVKEILDEQSSFAVEQIELAISSLEKEIGSYEELLKAVSDIAFPRCETLAKKSAVYQRMQKELNLLNTYASRINSLRKEIIKTDMRIRFKNRFFECLSKLGDAVFPKRKELVKQISEEFVKDVEKFVQVHFHGEEFSVPLFVLREEIKALQAYGKLLTLNTQAFTETRLRLSECWDKIKEKDKERRKDFLAKKQIFKQNFESVLEKIQTLGSLLQAGPLTSEEMNRQIDEIFSFMESLELGRDEIRMLEDEIHRIEEPLLEKKQREEEERQKQRKKEERERKEKIEQLKAKLIELAAGAGTIENERLIEQKDNLFKEFEQIAAHKSEKMEIERLFKQIKEKIEENRERAILNLSADDIQALEQLKEILEEKKQERQAIKQQLEIYRKALGGSGFGFEKAMQVRELIEEEKGRLDRINTSIEEIEEKISDSFF
jgi:hypothetical protein